MKPVDVILYSRVHDEVLEDTISLIRRFSNAWDYTLRVVVEAKSSARNVNEALACCRNRFVVSLHRDTKIIHPEWIDRLISHFEDPEVGIVGPAEIPNPESLARFESEGFAFVEKALPWDRLECIALSSSLLCFDRIRIQDDIRWNETLPGTCGGSEDDFCAQIRRRGFKAFAVRNVVVYHEDVTDPENVWKKHGYESPEEMWEAFRENRKYLSERWPHYFETPPEGVPVWPDVKVR